MAKKVSRIQRDRMNAQKYANSTASPYRKSARAAEDDAARGMTDAQIQALYGGSYDAATASAGKIGANTAAGAANASSILSGLVGSLPGAGSYDVTGLLTDYTNANTANAQLGQMYQASLQADIGTARNAGLAMAQGRRDERSDKLNAEARGLRLQGNVAAADTQTPLNNMLSIRAARQNLAMLKLQIEAQRMANDKAGRGGSGGSGGTSPTTDPNRSNVAATYKDILSQIQKQYGVVGKGGLGSEGSAAHSR